MNAEVLATTGAVVIGRNEGPRLQQCLGSIPLARGRVVYVDSGSTDGSPELARRNGVEVIVLSAGPFTAARGRQAGADSLLDRVPHLRYLFFVDGDCRVQLRWLESAVAYLEEHSDVAGVSGRRREEAAARSFYSNLLDIDWEQPPGDALHVSGDSVMRVAALREVGGWDVNLIAGEEPDLCFRMADCGWRFGRLEEEMTLHDAGMRRFSEYWRRAVRTGHAYAEVGLRHRRSAGRPWALRTAGILTHGLLLPTLGTLLAVIYWPAALVVLVPYVRMMVSLTLYARRRGRSMTVSAAYALWNTACKVANLLGVMKYLIARVSGRRVPLIEYRSDGGGGRRALGRRSPRVGTG